MASYWTDTEANAILDAEGAKITHLSAHTADPGQTGANEVTGGSYARKATTWGAAATRAKNLTGTYTFDLPAGVTVTHVGFRSALTAGNFYGAFDVPDKTDTDAWQYVLTSGQLSI